MPQWVACPLCRGELGPEITTLKAPVPVTWRECPKCKFLYQTPFPSPKKMEQFYAESYRDVVGGETYPDRHSRIISIRRAFRQMEMLQQAANGFKPTRILDWGCATGKALAEMREEWSAEVLGVEVGKRDVAACQKRGIPVVPELLPEHGKFDLIVLSHTLEHHISPVAHLAKLREHATDGGWLLIEVPAASSPSAYQVYHYYVFQPRTLEVVVRWGQWKPKLGTYNEASGLLWLVAKNEDGKPEPLTWVDAMTLTDVNLVS